MGPRLLTLTEISRELGVSRSWLYANVERLEREFGFPPAVPGMGSRRLSLAVDRWLERAQPAEVRAQRPEAEGDPDPYDIEAWRAVLDYRAERIAEEPPPSRRK